MLKRITCSKIVLLLLSVMTFTAAASSKWELGGGAVYLKPRVSYWDLGLVFDERVSPHTRYDWGGMLSAAYYYTDTSDINLNWFTYSQSNQDLVSQSMFDPLFNFVGTDTYAARYKNTFSLLNFEFGKTFFLKSAQLRAHVGGQYLNHDFAYNALDREEIAGGSFTSLFANDTNSRYQGGGPRVGLDVSHDLHSKKWSVFANGAAAVLLGQTKSSLYSRGISSRFVSMYDSIRKSRTVSELGVQLGLSYKTKIQSHQLTLSGGWLLNRFFNLIQTGPGSGHDAPITLSGPFLNAKISEDV